jgi:hypothetical protein
MREEGEKRLSSDKPFVFDDKGKHMNKSNSQNQLPYQPVR